MYRRACLRFATTCAVLCAAANARAVESVEVTLVDRSTIRGTIVEGRSGDYLVVREDKTERDRFIPYASMLGLWRFGGRYVERKDLDGTEVDTPIRATFALKFGMSALKGDYFAPYYSTGVVVGARVGVTLARPIALVVAFDHVSAPTGERNGHADAGRQEVLALLVRLSANAASGKAGVYFEAGPAMRWFAYSVAIDDGAVDWDLPRARTTARASMRGTEVRLALGLALTLVPALSADLMLELSPGWIQHYEDTLRCETFRFGRCGGGYSFAYTALGVGMQLRWR